MLSLDGGSPLRASNPVVAPVMDTLAETTVARHKDRSGTSFVGDTMTNFLRIREVLRETGDRFQERLEADSMICSNERERQKKKVKRRRERC